jgi:hypothetical protein
MLGIPHCLNSLLTDGGAFDSVTHRFRSTPSETFLYLSLFLTSVRGWVKPEPSAAARVRYVFDNTGPFCNKVCHFPHLRARDQPNSMNPSIWFSVSWIIFVGAVLWGCEHSQLARLPLQHSDYTHLRTKPASSTGVAIKVEPDLKLQQKKKTGKKEESQLRLSC